MHTHTYINIYLALRHHSRSQVAAALRGEKRRAETEAADGKPRAKCKAKAKAKAKAKGKKANAGTDDSVPKDTPTDTPSESVEGGEVAADPAADGSVPDKPDKPDADHQKQVLADLWEEKDW